MQGIGTFGNKGAVNSGIFSDFKKRSASTRSNAEGSLKQNLTADTVELSTKAAKKPLINKKTLIGAAVVAAGIAAAVLVGKNVQKTLSVMESQSNHSERALNDAKDVLINNPDKPFNIKMNGVCFYGPDCEAKEKALCDFIEDLSNAGFEIKNTPRASEADRKTIASVLENIVTGAKKLFQTENKKTAVVVRDLDKIAPDGAKEFSPVTGALKRHMEHAQENGMVFVTDAVDMLNVDPAVRRVGRLDQKILVQPLPTDSPAAHKKYAEILAYHASKHK